MAEFFPRKIGEALEESQEKPQDYRFFDSPEKRKELFDYSKAVAEYLRKERISNLILVDRGARPLYIGVREYLYSKYPEEEIPDIFFVNPRGFKSKEELTPDEIKFLNYKLQLSGDPEKKVRDQEEIMAEFRNRYRRLMKSKEDPTLIFDTCMHTGKSIKPIKKTLDRLGFSDLRIGLVSPPETGVEIEVDFYITEKIPEKICYPFDKETIVEKTLTRTSSRKTEDPQGRRKSIFLRKEIRKIIRDFLEENS